MNAVAKKRLSSSVNTDVYERLKLMIARREVEPGEQLVQQVLARQLGTSAMPVVEALRRLERDGLVIHVPRLGSFVRESTVEDLRELYFIRRGLESEACRAFVSRASADEKRALVELNAKLNNAAKSGSIGDYIEADVKFHMHIVNGARVARLCEIMENRHIEEKVFQGAPELQTGGSTDHLIGQHDAIVDAITRGDEDGAARAMRKHLVEAEEQYLAAVTKFRESEL